METRIQNAHHSDVEVSQQEDSWIVWNALKPNQREHKCLHKRLMNTIWKLHWSRGKEDDERSWYEWGMQTSRHRERNRFTHMHAHILVPWNTHYTLLVIWSIWRSKESILVGFLTLSNDTEKFLTRHCSRLPVRSDHRSSMRLAGSWDSTRQSYNTLNIGHYTTGKR